MLERLGGRQEVVVISHVKVVVGWWLWESVGISDKCVEGKGESSTFDV